MIQGNESGIVWWNLYFRYISKKKFIMSTLVLQRQCHLIYIQLCISTNVFSIIVCIKDLLTLHTGLCLNIWSSVTGRVQWGTFKKYQRYEFEYVNNHIKVYSRILIFVSVMTQLFWLSYNPTCLLFIFISDAE